MKCHISIWKVLSFIKKIIANSHTNAEVNSKVEYAHTYTVGFCSALRSILEGQFEMHMPIFEFG